MFYSFRHGRRRIEELDMMGIDSTSNHLVTFCLLLWLAQFKPAIFDHCCQQIYKE